MPVQLDELRDGMLAAPVDYHHWPLFSTTSVQTTEKTRLLLAIELILVDFASLYLLVKGLEQLLFEPYSLPPAAPHWASAIMLLPSARYAGAYVTFRHNNTGVSGCQICRMLSCYRLRLRRKTPSL